MLFHIFEKINNNLETSTISEYKEIINICKDIYLKKSKDYGSAWRILRTTSLTDQIFIKAQRIRSTQEKKKMKVDEKIENEFIGIINYCVMALIQLDLKDDERLELPAEDVVKMYNHYIKTSKELMQQKNHDYGEAWKEMRISSLTDLILQKLLRIKQIEKNNGKTIVSEGIDANYQDIINYSVFALIHLNILEND